MTTAPLATIGIPFKNEEALLGRAIRSVLAQTVREVEILLVDDGSTDGSLAVARSFDDPRIILTSDGTNRGLPARLNEIVRRARADVVLRMDADDVTHPRRLERELAVMRATRCDVVASWTALIDANDRVFGVAEAPIVSGVPAHVMDRGAFAHPTMLARREWLLAHPYDDAVGRAEDRDLFCRTSTTSHFEVIPEVLYALRVHHRDGDFWRDYLTGQEHMRIIYRRYGPSFVGPLGTARRVAASHLKSALMLGAMRVGLADKLIRSRGREPTPSELARVEEALAASAAQRA